MTSLWEKKFKPMEIETPREIVDTQCYYLSKSTDGKVVAKISEYNEPIFSYTKKNSLDLSSLIGDEVINIQNDLGDIAGGSFTYEFSSHLQLRQITSTG